MRFRMAGAVPVGHAAGQYVDLVVPTARGIPFRRSYSIASAPDPAQPDTFEVAVTRVDGGLTSEALHALPLGGAVEVGEPRGTFTRTGEDRDHPALFVAAGTGLAPIRAMLSEDVKAAEGAPLVLLFGCRTQQDVLWGDELRGWEATCPRFRVQVTLSRPQGVGLPGQGPGEPPEWSGLTGYVQRHAVSLCRALPGARVYVCGLSAMVDDVVGLLAGDGGVPRSALRYETYD
jgi:CDP-4-dehydro-6-deoxyglucose reductase, E3